jgi:hypothetical protein
MKSLKVLCAVGILSLFSSCAYQEDRAAFFIENQLSENLIIERAFNEMNSTADTDIYRNVTLDLTTSESYDKYILRLTQLDISKFEFNFSDYQGNIENGKLFLDDLLLGDFNASMDRFSIEDPDILQRIEELFLERTALDLTFVGESDTAHFLSVSVQVEMKGTFVH